MNVPSNSQPSEIGAANEASLNAQPEPQPVASSRVPSVPLKLIGIGNAGINVLDQAVVQGFPANAFVAINTDVASLAHSTAVEKIHLEQTSLRDFKESSLVGAKDDGQAAQSTTQGERFKALCQGARVVAIVAGLGGGAGTGIGPMVAAAARETGALTLAFVLLPFECEGNLRKRIAASGLEDLKRAADLVVCLPNERALSLISESTSLIDTFRASNQLLAKIVCGVWHTFAGESVMGLPLSDLCRMTAELSADCAFGTEEASGADRATEVLDKLFAHPMLGGSANFSEAQSVAACTVGGPGLGMAEVNRIMERIQREAQGAPVMMGVVINPAVGDRLVVTLLVGCPDKAPDEVATGGRSTMPASDSARGVESDPDSLLVKRPHTRPHSRFVPPPPPTSPENLEHLRSHKNAAPASRSKKSASRLRQGQLPLEIVSKGRFDKSEPTIHKGEDLDVPTYIRRGVSLN